MGRRIWLALAVATLIALSFATSVVATKSASDTRSRYVTRGLDFLHSRQGSTGGFGDPQNTSWAVVGAVANGERMGDGAWHVNGKNPVDYLQATDLVAAASASTVTNPPVYYARLMMAYAAMDRTAMIATAGSKSVNLLKILLSYQNTTEGSEAKGAIAPLPQSTSYAVRTTAWAILAMYNAKVSPTDPDFVMAEEWLAAQQNDGSGGDGGFASGAKGGTSTAVDTALACQALLVSSDGSDWDRSAARAFLAAAQNDSGGFPGEQGTQTDAEATSAAIQAILALGEDPQSSAWTKGTDTPVTALRGLQRTNGSYKLSAGRRTRPTQVSGWALAALAEKPFTTYPRAIPAASKPFKFRPQIKTISPKNDAVFSHTHVVLIRATYTDLSPRGTGIMPSACRLYVDNANRTSSADIGRYGLHLELKNVPNGIHSYTIKLVDYAGNERIVARKFTVKVPVITPTTQPTYNPAPVYPTTYPTAPSTPTPSATATTPSPYGSLTPSPSASPTATASPVVIGTAIPSPSASASPAGSASGGGGSAAGFVGGTLLAMLPIGAVISYLLLRRREDILGTASQGSILAGGGSPSDHLKQTLARSKDLVRPSSRR